MTRKATGKARLGVPTLTSTDWAEAALQLVAEKGLAALTVSNLAGRLGVTKGSFYWHFEGRSDLLAAALHRWEQRSTTETMKALDAVADPRRRLEMMFSAASEAPRARSLYAALSEAAEDPIVRRVLNRVASSRITYLEKCYVELGLKAAEAKSWAVLAYSAYRGLLQLAHEAAGALPSNWSAYSAMVCERLIPSTVSVPSPAQRRAARKRAG